MPRRKPNVMTMPEIITAHLTYRWEQWRSGARPDPYVAVYELRGREVEIDAHRTAWIGHSGDRRAREMVAKGEIVTETRGGIAHYALKREAQTRMGFCCRLGGRVNAGRVRIGSGIGIR